MKLQQRLCLAVVIDDIEGGMAGGWADNCSLDEVAGVRARLPGQVIDACVRGVDTELDGGVAGGVVGDTALRGDLVVGRDGGLAKVAKSDEDCWHIHDLDELI